MSRLEVDHVSKTYPAAGGLLGRLRKGPGRSGPKVALRDVCLTVSAGEVVGLVGRNGAGKTTLLKCILNLVRPDQGSIRVSGQLADSSGNAHRREIGYVSPVERSFYLRLTAAENLLFFSRLHGGSRGEIRQRVDLALDHVDLADRAGDRVDRLSSGMRQRLALARALLHDPSLLLLDEPTRSLDPLSRRHMQRLIGAGRQSGRGVLIASHDLDEVESLCDRVVVLDAGEVRTAGDVRRALGIEPRWEILLDGSAPPEVASEPGVTLDPARPDRLQLVPPSDEALGGVLARLHEAGRRVRRLQRSDRPLGDAS